MAQLTYEQFVSKYYPSGGHATDWLQGAYNKYASRISSGTISEGEIPTGERPPRPEDYAPTLPAGFPEPPVSPTAGAYNWNPVTGKWDVDPTVPPPTDLAPTEPTEPTMPTFGEGPVAEIPTPAITPAPPYVKTEAQIGFEETLSTMLTDWVQAKGYGLEPEVQAQMIQKQTDTLKAREQEAIRVMKINMHRRGLTNTGYIQANENMITSNTSVAIAGAIADVQIKSALMKMASFEKAMGAAAQFLGYLSEQSQLANQPEFATWQAEQLKTMQTWQGKLDVYKMELNQAYQTENMTLQAELTSGLNQEQHQFDLELAEMEIEANQKIAMAQGIGGIFGTILGFIFGK